MATIDTFNVTGTCVCGDMFDEFFLDNDDSKTELLKFVLLALEAGVDDIEIKRNKVDGTIKDETVPILLALAIGFSL